MNEAATDLPRIKAQAVTSMTLARVAELADAQASGACVLRDVRVQIPPRAHENPKNTD